MYAVFVLRVGPQAHLKVHMEPLSGNTPEH